MGSQLPILRFVDVNGKVSFTLKGKYHRLDGPAVEWPNGTKEWWIKGKRHRTDGPAIIKSDGKTYWYIRDTNITDWIKQQGISDNPTQEEQTFIALNWC